MSPDKDPLSGLAYAYGGPLARARVRAEPEDFQVFETLSFVPSGRGEHLFLRVRKRQWTTEAAAAALARALGVRRDQVSYAGMKDKQALTEQWFSVHLPGRGLELPLGELERGLWLVEATRNDRKLRRGALAGNRFRLLLRELDNNSTTALGARLVRIAWAGVPNYFGVQRFGRDGDNIALAQAFFSGSYRPRGRHLRGVLFSAARAQLFNEVLSRRVALGNWNTLLPGELAMLDGRGSFFAVDELSPQLQRRVRQLEIHPSGPLPGSGGQSPTAAAGELEADVLQEAAELVAGLQRHGVEAARRALRLKVSDLHWRQPTADTLELGFSLPAGAYATTVLRELIVMEPMPA